MGGLRYESAFILFVFRDVAVPFESTMMRVLGEEELCVLKTDASGWKGGKQLKYRTQNEQLQQ